MGRESRCSPENLLSHIAENFPRRESFGFPLFPGTEKLSIRKGGERIKAFCRKILVSLWRKISQGTLLCYASELFERKCFMEDRGGECQDFPSKSFCISQYQENSRGNPCVLCFRKITVAKKSMNKGE